MADTSDYFVTFNPFENYNTVLSSSISSIGESPFPTVLSDGTEEEQLELTESSEGATDYSEYLRDYYTNGGQSTFSGIVSSDDQSISYSKPAGATISEEMFLLLLKREGCHKNADGTLRAHAEYKKFGEKHVTGPYGMVYKHIDKNGNKLEKPLRFKEGESVTEAWAKINARVYYDKKAAEWKKVLKGKKVTLNLLDALVSAMGGTVESQNTFRNYVLKHWGDWQTIASWWKHFATTAAGNHKVMPGLVKRRIFESNWFLGNK